MRLVFMGSPEFAVLPLQLLISNGHHIAAVYTPPDRPSGRGRELLPPPVKQAALSLGLPVVQVPSLKNDDAVAQLTACRPEAIVVAAFGKILPQAVLEIPTYGCLNIHPSLLPKYRGPSPVVSTILSGDEFAGVSLMRLDAGMDTGPVFKRAMIPVLPHDSAASLTPRLFQVGAYLLLEVLAALPGGKEIPEPQKEAEATYTREITKEDGRIDWRLSAMEVWRRVRAYYPWPAAYTSWQGKQLKILEAVPLAASDKPEPGQVIALLPARCPARAAFGVGTGDGILGVMQVQIEGKRAMPAGEFMRGQRDFIGARFS